MIKINNIEVSEDELRRVIKENPSLLEKTKSKMWTPNYLQTYFYINEFVLDKVENDQWEDSDADNALCSVNNLFQTKELAKKELARRKAEKILRDFCKDYDGEYIYNGSNYTVYYNHTINCFDIYKPNQQYKPSWLYLETQEDARKLIDTHSAELKLYFEIK